MEVRLSRDHKESNKKLDSRRELWAASGSLLVAAPQVDRGVFARQGGAEVLAGTADPVVDGRDGDASRRATSEAAMPFAYAMMARNRWGVVLQRRKASVSRAR